MTTTDYRRMIEATTLRECTPNYKKTLKGWQKEASAIYKALSLATEIYENTKKKIYQDYSEKKASELIAEEQRKYAEMQKFAEDDIRSKFNEVLSSKRETIRKSNSAPSEADLRLLQALKMRTKLTESDIIHAAEALGNNLVSLGTLADIASSHNIHIPIPTAEKIEQRLNEAIDFANSMMRELTTSNKDLPYRAREFYLYPDSDETYAAMLFSGLDDSVFSTEQMKKTVTNSSSFLDEVKDNYGATKIMLTGGTPNAVEIKLTGNENLSNIAYQFGTRLSDIEKVNSGKNIYDLGAGDVLVVPSGRMKMLNGNGNVSTSQCEPICINAFGETDNATS